jgi:hypothetical protein
VTLEVKQIRHTQLNITACQTLYRPGNEIGVKMQDYINKDGMLKWDNHTPGCTWPDGQTGGKTQDCTKVTR